MPSETVPTLSETVPVNTPQGVFTLIIFSQELTARVPAGSALVPASIRYFVGATLVVALSLDIGVNAP